MVCPKKVGLFQFKVGWFKIKTRTNLGPQNYMYPIRPWPADVMCQPQRTGVYAYEKEEVNTFNVFRPFRKYAKLFRG